MRKSFTYLVLVWCMMLFTSVGYATSYILSATSGAVIISNTSTTPSLVGDDTLFIQSIASFSNVQYQNLNGSAGHFIHIVWLPGSMVTSPFPTFQQPSDFSNSYVKVDAQYVYNWYGKETKSTRIHDFYYSHCQWVNPTGSYQQQPPIQWDDAFASPDMVFTGSISQTFYNIKYLDCKWDGYLNVVPMNVSSFWGSGTEPKRSIGLNWEFARDTFQNITTDNTNPSGTTVAGISGTGFNWKVHDCRFFNIMGVGSFQHAHSASILFWGSGDFYNNYQGSSYASLVRGVPLSWSGLVGYQGNDSSLIRIWNSITFNSESYSAFELGQNNKANRTSGNGCYVARASVYNCTVYRTVKASYNAPYHGAICDDVNQDTLDVSFNMIMLPETDVTFDSTTNEYVVPIISAAPTNLTKNGNKIYPVFSTAVIQDTVNLGAYYPSAGSPLINGGILLPYRLFDYYGNAIVDSADIGAVQRPTLPFPPSCTTNSSPADSATIATATSATIVWNAASTATSYAIYVNGSFVANTSALTYGLTGLTPDTYYSWYVVPANPFGSATGCASTATVFKTHTAALWLDWFIYRQ